MLNLILPLATLDIPNLATSKENNLDAGVYEKCFAHVVFANRSWSFNYLRVWPGKFALDVSPGDFLARSGGWQYSNNSWRPAWCHPKVSPPPTFWVFLWIETLRLIAPFHPQYWSRVGIITSDSERTLCICKVGVRSSKSKLAKLLPANQEFPESLRGIVRKRILAKDKLVLIFCACECGPMSQHPSKVLVASLWENNGVPRCVCSHTQSQQMLGDCQISWSKPWSLLVPTPGCFQARGPVVKDIKRLQL